MGGGVGGEAPGCDAAGAQASQRLAALAGLASLLTKVRGCVLS